MRVVLFRDPGITGVALLRRELKYDLLWMEKLGVEEKVMNYEEQGDTAPLS